VLYGHICDPVTDETVDEASAAVDEGPAGFSGERVESSYTAHGGLIVVERVAELVLAAGARRAGPGEVQHAALLNGRLDLTPRPRDQ